jgi:hypothetical protein
MLAQSFWLQAALTDASIALAIKCPLFSESVVQGIVQADMAQHF